jgi:GATA-binding protein
LQDFRLDLSLTHGAVHPDLLRPAAFPSFEQSAARENQRLEEMQRQDPLATQIWRFYTKTKQLLPAQERMENLTWRLMHLELQKRRAANAAKYGYVLVWFPESGRERCADSGRKPRNSRVPATTNAPSGIAQLRKSSEHAPLPPSDPMNLDDFIHHDNIGTPAGLALTPTPETMRQAADDHSAHSAAAAAAIPIKSRKEPAQQSQHLVPQSVPVAAHQRVQNEFGYLPRHPPRKTSIDETAQRVSLRAFVV